MNLFAPSVAEKHSRIRVARRAKSTSCRSFGGIIAYIVRATILAASGGPNITNLNSAYFAKPMRLIRKLL